MQKMSSDVASGISPAACRQLALQINHPTLSKGGREKNISGIEYHAENFSPGFDLLSTNKPVGPDGTGADHVNLAGEEVLEGNSKHC